MDRTTLGSLVWTLSTRWRTEVDRVTTPLGFTHAQYSALLALSTMTRRGAKPTQKALADKLAVSAIYASKLLRALEAQGLVARSPDSADSRMIRLSLTEAGRAKITEARAAVDALDLQLTEPLGDPDGEMAQRFRIALRGLLLHQARLAKQRKEQR